MITKLIALLTLLFVPLHISNNIVKDGEGGISETSLSRPQKTTLREIKKARDYNEYYGNNSFNVIDKNMSLTYRDVTITTNDNNTFTYTGTYNLKAQTPPKIKISQIDYKSQNNSFLYVSAKHLAGTCSNAVTLSISLWYTNQNGGESKIAVSLNENNTGFDTFIDLNTIGYNISINSISLNPKQGTYNNYTFSLYVFCPSNNDNYVPYGDIYTGTQVEDQFAEYMEEKNKQSFPLYNSSLTYTNSSETLSLSGYKPSHYNYVTFNDLYNDIDVGLNGAFTTTCTIIFEFNSGVFASDLQLKASNFNKIQIYGRELFYQKDFGGGFGDFDLSSITLNDTQKRTIISKVILTYVQFRFTDDIALMVENKTNSFSYQAGFDSGKKEGEVLGYNNGYKNGIRDGYNDGYEVGRNENIANKNYNVFTLVSAAFSNIGKLLNVEIYNGLTIGTIVCIPIIFCVMLFIIKMIKG